MLVLYTLAVLVLALALSPWFLYQALAYRKHIGSLAQRMGHLPVSFNLDGDESIWIHAVSVGEALTARALIPDLRERYPDLKISITHGVHFAFNGSFTCVVALGDFGFNLLG